MSAMIDVDGHTLEPADLWDKNLEARQRSNLEPGSPVPVRPRLVGPIEDSRNHFAVVTRVARRQVSMSSGDQRVQLRHMVAAALPRTRALVVSGSVTP